MSVPVIHDVIVMGAGPAGCAAAIRLLELGLDVAIVELFPFPRPHVGICLADPTLALVELLGLGPAFHSEGFWRRTKTAVKWGKEAAQLTDQSGFHVDRARLDQIMLSRAAQLGATVYQPARLAAPPKSNGEGWACQLKLSEGVFPVQCRFIVDGGGRRTALHRKRIRDSFPLIALVTEWHLDDAQRRFDGLIESGLSGWAWFAQTGNQRAVASIFVDPKDLQTKGPGAVQASFMRLIHQFPEMLAALNNARNLTVHACDASSSHAAEPVSSRHISIGDACMSVDPLSAQGVHLALQSGIQCAAVINTILNYPKNAALAQQFYRDRVDERVAMFSDRSRAEYGRVAAESRETFWTSRGTALYAEYGSSKTRKVNVTFKDLNIMLCLSSDITIENVAVIDGNYVENRTAINHPNLDRPIAFFSGVHLQGLLARIPEKLTLRDLCATWTADLGPAQSEYLANWLWQNGLLLNDVSTGRKMVLRTQMTA